MKIGRSRGLIIIALFIILCLMGCGSGGGGGGSTVELTNVSGTVVDTNGIPIPGAAVTILSDPVTVFTNEKGEFIVGVEAGDHSITITSGSLEIFTGNFTISSGTPLELPEVKASFAVAFEIILGDSEKDAGNEVIQTREGDYMVVGRTKSNTGSGTNVYLVKINVKGTVMWAREYEEVRDDAGNSIYQTLDGGFIIAGWTESVDNGRQVYLIKTDADGVKDWDKSYGGIDFEQGKSVQQTSDGGYVVVGTTRVSSTDTDIYLIKTDANGDMNEGKGWAKTYGGEEIEEGTSVQQTTDGGYIITGRTLSFNAVNSDIYLVKTDSQGAIEPEGIDKWSKTFGSQEPDFGESVRQTIDGGFIIAGRSSDVDQAHNDVYLLKTDEAGGEVWKNYFGGENTDHGYSVRQTIDGGYIIAGDFGKESAYLIKTDAGGGMTWERIFDGNSRNLGLSVCQTKDGGYIMTGRTNLVNDVDENVYIIKTDANGNTE